jgi:dipeptidyl aminopeptidase/acylaminoacyl peptidase
MLNGLSPDFLNTPPSPERVAAISPMAQLRAGRFTTPTFLVHGEKDEIVPFHTAVKFADALKGYGVKGGLLAVKGAKHIHDLSLRPGTERWQQEVAPGYDFLFSTLDERT